MPCLSNSDLMDFFKGLYNLCVTHPEYSGFVGVLELKTIIFAKVLIKH